MGPQTSSAGVLGGVDHLSVIPPSYVCEATSSITARRDDGRLSGRARYPFSPRKAGVLQGDMVMTRAQRAKLAADGVPVADATR